MDLHHIISDGVSINLLTADFLFAEYQGKENPLPPIQYKDYAVWQQTDEQQSRLEKSKQYWLNQMEGELQVLEFPTDYLRPPVQSFVGGSISIESDPDLLEDLQRLSKEEKVTPFSILMAVYMVFLHNPVVKVI